ncbi:MAG: hypothetical protein AB2792_23095 [Candidatus Thiodiazotropha sp.]
MTIDEIEYAVAQGTLDAAKCFTLMQQKIDLASDRHYRNGFMAGWNAGITGDYKTKINVEARLRT